MSLVIGILTFVLVITSLFLVMIVLMQRAKSDGGIGSAMGGGSMESTFGAETGNVLSGATIKASIVFFVVSLVLYLAQIYQRNHGDGTDSALPTISAPASSSTGPVPTPASTSPVANPLPETTPAPASGPLPQPETSAPVEAAK